MGKNNSGNASSMGTGNHIEYHYPKKKGKNSKYKCPFYRKAPDWCVKLNITCVGVSHSMCPRKKKAEPPKKKAKVIHAIDKNIVKVQKKDSQADYTKYMNKKISHKENGPGVIVNVNGNTVSIKHDNNDEIVKYSMRFLLEKNLIEVLK